METSIGPILLALDTREGWLCIDRSYAEKV